MDAARWALRTEVRDGSVVVRWAVQDADGRTLAEATVPPEVALVRFRAGIEQCVHALELGRILDALVETGWEPTAADAIVARLLAAPIESQPVDT